MTNSSYEDDMLERDLQEVADHGVRIYCNRHKLYDLDSCDLCEDEAIEDERQRREEFWNRPLERELTVCDPCFDARNRPTDQHGCIAAWVTETKPSKSWSVCDCPCEETSRKHDAMRGMINDSIAEER